MKNVLFLPLMAAALLMAGCESLSTRGTAPDMSLTATRADILVNESATVLVKSQNTLGAKPSITWSSSMGKITPVKEGMLDFRSDKPAAIFTSDHPGVATVTATLKLDNGQTLSDSVQIQVDPLH
jgi:hypothetical protein